MSKIYWRSLVFTSLLFVAVVFLTNTTYLNSILNKDKSPESISVIAKINNINGQAESENIPGEPDLPDAVDDYQQIVNTVETPKTESVVTEQTASATKIVDNTWKLPFRAGTYIQLHQGYFGQFSHQGKYALDFPHTEGIDILAARGGKIIELDNGDKWDQWCISDRDCQDKGSIWKGNHIIIQHSDNSTVKYLHFRPGSIATDLMVGSKVNQGDFLGKMGGTGYTCLTPACTEPDNHLHFEALLDGKTIPTPFSDCNAVINKCDSKGWVIQGKYYTVQ